MNEKNRVCPVERAGMLESVFRRLIHNPKKILGPFVKHGMTVVDFGCGPGFFTMDMAQMVGTSGHVIACDLQDGMLEKVKIKSAKSGLQEIMALHKCRQDKVDLYVKADFVLAFYIMHEIPNQEKLLGEIFSWLNKNGKLLIVEPPFHVSKNEFNTTIALAKSAGLVQNGSPRVLLSKTALFSKA